MQLHKLKGTGLQTVRRMCLRRGRIAAAALEDLVQFRLLWKSNLNEKQPDSNVSGFLLG